MSDNPKPSTPSKPWPLGKVTLHVEFDDAFSDLLEDRYGGLKRVALKRLSEAAADYLDPVTSTPLAKALGGESFKAVIEAEIAERDQKAEVAALEGVSDEALAAALKSRQKDGQKDGEKDGEKAKSSPPRERPKPKHRPRETDK